MSKVTLFEYNGVFFTNEKKYANAEQGLKDLIGNEICVLPINSNNSKLNEELKVLEVTDGLGNTHDLDVYSRSCLLTDNGINEGYLINHNTISDAYIEVNGEKLEVVDLYVQSNLKYVVNGLKIPYRNYNEFYYTDSNDIPCFDLIKQLEKHYPDDSEAETSEKNERNSVIIEKYESDNDLSFEYDEVLWTTFEIDEYDFYTAHGINIHL